LFYELQTLLKIFRFLYYELRHTRPVNRRWDSVASVLLQKHHKVKFVTQREFSCYLYISKDWKQPTFISKFVLDLTLLDLDSIRAFAINHGPRVLEYTFSYGNGIQYDERISSQDCGMKELILLQHSPNIQSLTILPNSRISNSSTTRWKRLPVYRSLRKVVWEKAIYYQKSALHLLAKAPALQHFSCDALQRSTKAAHGRTSLDMSNFFPLLPVTVELSATVPDLSYERSQVEALKRVSEGRNRIHLMDVQLSGWWNRDKWATAFESFLSSQAESLRNLRIKDISNTHRIPQLNVLEELTLDKMSTNTLVNLNPAHFPALKALTFGSCWYFTVAHRPIWTSVRSLTLKAETCSMDVLTLQISEVFPNLEKFTFEFRLTLPTLVCYVLRNVSHVQELSMCLHVYNGDTWEELTGGAERVPTEDLLAENMNLPQEQCRPHSFGSFHRKSPRHLSKVCQTFRPFVNISDLKRLKLSYSVTIRCLDAIVYASIHGHLKLDRLELLCCSYDIVSL